MTPLKVLPKYKAPRTCFTKIVREKLKELNELEPVFSIRQGKIGFTTRVDRDELLTLKEAALWRNVTPQYISFLVREGQQQYKDLPIQTQASVNQKRGQS